MADEEQLNVTGREEASFDASEMTLESGEGQIQGTLLWRGEFSNLFMAVQPGASAPAQYAVKIPHDVEGHDERLTREFELLRQLQHSAICKAIRIDRVLFANGDLPRSCLVLDRSQAYQLSAVEKSLADGGGPFSRAELLRVMKQLCSVTDFLHGRNIVHGQLNSRHILLNYCGKVTLVDFGLARALDASEAAREKAREMQQLGKVFERIITLNRLADEERDLRAIAKRMLSDEPLMCKELRTNRLIASGDTVTKKTLNCMNTFLFEDRKKPESLGGYEVDFGAVLGCGSYSTVFFAYQGTENYALKMINLARMSREMHHMVTDECAILKRHQHPNIIKLHDSFQGKTPEASYSFVVMEFFAGKELFEVLKALEIEACWLNEEEILFIMAQLTDLLQYLARFLIIHRDLKPENILINECGVVKVIDFGFAKKARLSGLVRGSCGSPGYCAPETVLDRQSTPQSDIFAVGCLFHLLIYKRALYEEKSLDNLAEILQSCNFDFPEVCESMRDAGDLLKMMLVKCPKKRISAHQLKSHNYFASVAWEALQSETSMKPFSRKIHLFETID